MLDLGLHLTPDKMLNVTTGAMVNYIPSPELHPLPDTNTRIVSLSESDLALLLALLDESLTSYIPIRCVLVRIGTGMFNAVPNPRQADYVTGDRVIVGATSRLIHYAGDVDKQDSYPLLPNLARELLRERVAVVRERLMVDLTAYMTRIAEALEGIEVEVGDATSALERVATAVESQTTSEGLDDIASAVGALAPLVALI